MSAPQHSMTDSHGNLWTIPPTATRAIGRFNPAGPTGYRAVEPWAVDAPIRATRAEAREDVQVGTVDAELQARIEAAL